MSSYGFHDSSTLKSTNDCDTLKLYFNKSLLGTWSVKSKEYTTVTIPSAPAGGVHVFAEVKLENWP